MAFENPCVKLVGVQAAADLSTHQHKFVKITAAEQVNVCSVLGEAAVGVLLNKPSALGQAAEVATTGSIVKVVSSAAFAAGAVLTAAATGKAVTAAATQYGHAIAIQAATAGDQLVTALLIPSGKV